MTGDPRIHFCRIDTDHSHPQFQQTSTGSTRGTADFDTQIVWLQIETAPCDRFGCFVVGARNRFVLRFDWLHTAGPAGGPSWAMWVPKNHWDGSTNTMSSTLSPGRAIRLAASHRNHFCLSRRKDFCGNRFGYFVQTRFEVKSTDRRAILGPHMQLIKRAWRTIPVRPATGRSDQKPVLPLRLAERMRRRCE